jgi:hypothetical protein
MPATAAPSIWRGRADWHALHFADLAAIQGGRGSPEGQAAAADVQTFATGGVDIFMFDTRTV